MKDGDMPTAAARIEALIAEQASEWLVKLEDAGGHERAAFSDWLTASPAHVSAFLDARATWEALSGRAFDRMPDDETLLLRAGVEPVPQVAMLRTAQVSRRPRRLFALAAGLAGIALAAGAAFWVLRAADPDHAVYATNTGEQAAHTLPDGSTLSLNTRSKVRLEWSARFRDIHLETGEALFEVAHDPARPFRVWAGHSVIQAVGTRFNVYRTDKGVTVTVLEGRVQVKEDGASTRQPPSAVLDAGEQASIAPSAAVQTRTLTAPDRVVSWQSRRLFFDGEPLAEVVEEFNRYNEVPLVLEDPALRTRRIHGIFDSTDRASLITFLEDTGNIQVERHPGAIVIRQR